MTLQEARVAGMDAKGAPGSRRPASPLLLFAICITAMFMASLDQSIVATTLPALHTDLRTSLSWAAWTITAYQLGLIMALPVAGRLSDQFGRKRLFLVALAIFTLSSALCATANDIYSLVSFRFIQALGGGAFTPSAIGIITDHFGKNRDRAVGMITSVVPIGSLSGPVLGGLIVGYASWRGVFIINLPVGLLVFLLVLRFVPSARPRENVRADVKGSVLLAAVLVPLMLAITSLGEGATSPLSPQCWIPFLVFAVSLCFFLRHASSAANPVIPLRLIVRNGFGRLNIINYLYGGCALGFGALVPLYAQERYHFTSLQAGTVLSARACGVLLVGTASALLIRRVGYRRPMIFGFVMAATGMFLIGVGPHGLGTYAWLAMSAAIMGTGNGVAAPSTNNAMLSSAPDEAGAISGLRGMFRQIGAISMVSVATAVASRSTNPGLALGSMFILMAAIIIVVVIPLALRVPDHRGAW
jgi:EmrB/QacA subfamily drug resistance transporter